MLNKINFLFAIVLHWSAYLVEAEVVTIHGYHEDQMEKFLYQVDSIDSFDESAIPESSEYENSK